MYGRTENKMNFTQTLPENRVEGLQFEESISRDENLAKVEIALLAVIFLVTVVGNSTVLLALWTRKRFSGRKKLSRMYFFILHLSIADLITAFLSVLPQLGWDITFRFKGGPIMCKVVKFGQVLGPYLSSYILMATAVDRHQAICYPLTYCSWTSRRSKVMVYVAWLASLIFCIPQLTIFSFGEVVEHGIPTGEFDCWATFEQPWGQNTYVIWYCISVFIVPLLVLVYTYTCICREIWKNSESILRSRSTRKHGSNRRMPFISRAKINTVKQTVAVIVIYIICSAPFIVAQLWSTIDPFSPYFEGPVFTILMLLFCLNSCVNPWIYLSFNRELPKLLLRHYTDSTKSYNRSSEGEAGATGKSSSDCWYGVDKHHPGTQEDNMEMEKGHSRSNSSCEVQSTSLRPFSRWSLVANSRSKSSPRALTRSFQPQQLVTTAT